MSGGVDSSVSALLLIKEGFHVEGFTMLHFDSRKHGFAPGEGADAAVRDAAIVCKDLRIPHHVIDVKDKFEEQIVQYFVDSYRRAETPNACVRCNKHIKWGVFMDAVLDRGFDSFATGHFIRKKTASDGELHILRSPDSSRDQTYMLWQLSRRQFERTLFPVGTLEKHEVRKIAGEARLHVSQRRDSQENCFIPGDYRTFLKNHLRDRPGLIRFHDGQALGRHEGLANYTLGQRRHLGIAWSDPLYVYRMDFPGNTLWVTDERTRLEATGFYVRDVHWIDERIPVDLSLTVQVRYNAVPTAVESLQTLDEGLRVTVRNPLHAVTPGQSAVFYHGDRLLGGGIITA